MAVALARWALGVVLLFYGIGKFSDVSAFAKKFLQPAFEKTWLPDWLVVAFGFAMPYLEVILGILLILGLARNTVLFVTGLYLMILTFGQILLQQPQVVFSNFIFTIVAAAILFMEEYDHWVLWRRRVPPPGPTP